MLLSGFMLYRSLIRTLGGEPVEAARITQRIAGGDLTHEIRIRPGDQHSLLAAIRAMQESLRTIIRGIGESADTLTASAHEISLAANQVATAAHTQSDKSASMAICFPGMASSVKRAATSAMQEAISVSVGDQVSEGVSLARLTAAQDA